MSFATLCANAETLWFDAGISGYADWPTDGANVTVAGQGVWTNTQYAALNAAEHRLEVVSSDEVQDGLEFDAATRRRLEVNDTAVLHAEVMFSQFSYLPAIVSGIKGAIVALAGEDNGDAAYYGVVAAADGDTNTWRRLEGATPDTNATVMVNIAVTRQSDDEYSVMYSIGEMVLSSGGETEFPINIGEATAMGAILRGRGYLSSLSADSTAEPLMASLTIPAVDNVSVESVTVAGTPVELSNGVYRVQAGSVVTMTFAPAAGYAFAIGSAAVQELVVMEDTTLDSGLPSAVLVNGVVTINEVMASGTNTFRGVTGIDWVELKNNGDVDIDLTGWYLFDDPTKDQSKWIKIEGSCIVPAHGFKIVWADKSYEFAAGEAWTRIGLSSDGETVFLAGPDGTEVSRVEFPGLPKNMSYGVGRLVGTEEDSLVIFKESTPEAANTTDGYGPMTPEVTFSVTHGWKTEEFDLELLCAAEPEAAIYYTTNGASPTTSSILYNPNEPIHISRTTCIRAAVPHADAYLQLDSSATYLFLADIKQQTRGVVPNGFPADRAVNNQSMLYGMKQDIVNGADSQRLEEGFTNSAFVATLSLVVDTNNLFAADSGIYVNGTKDGRDWERQTMVEQIDPVHGAANEFSIPAGLRIRGASSRGAGYPKHSLRLFFRSDYGKGSLDFKLFGDEGASSFEKVDLRTSQNHAWANSYYYGHSISWGDTFVHEVFSRDTQRDMGEPYARTRNYHLFINGHYWGMYQTEERGDEDYAATYNGGDKDNYDAIKSSQVNGSRVTGPTSGNADAWNAMWDMAINQGFTGTYESNYMKIMGKNPNGSRNAEYPVYLDPTNLITYMLISHYVVDADTPASTWAAALPNNLVAFRDRVDDDKKLKRQGFMYLRHDCEHSMGVNPAPTPEVTNEVKTAYYTDPTIRGTELWSQAYANNNSFNNRGSFNPAVLNYKLGFNTEYKTLLGDLFYKHCLRPGGVLTPDMAKARFASRTNEIDNAIVCEAARWGRHARATRDYWLLSCSNVVDFIDHRMPYMVAQYRNRGWYPSIDAPVAVDAATEGTRLADGAVIPDGGKVFIDCKNDVYYTTDGSDPRLAGGGVSSSAVLYDSSEGITPDPGKFVLTMRAKSASGEWSAKDVVPLEGEVVVQTDQKLGVRILEIYSSTTDGGDTGEFITLTNLLDRAVSLDGMKLDAYNAKNNPPKALFSIEFGEADSIPANGAIKLMQDVKWSGKKISNGKVSMDTTDAHGKSIQHVYVDASWWDGACDESGRWFVALDFGDNVTEDTQWKPSALPQSKYDAGDVVECDNANEANEKATAITDNPREYINVPEGVEGEDSTKYTDLFKGVVVSASEKFSVSIELTDAAKESVATNANEVAAVIPLSEIAASGEAGTATVLNPVPGLWYSLSYGTNIAELAEWLESDRTMATSAHAAATDDESRLKLAVPRPDGDKCFYRVNVNVQTNAVQQ